MAVNSHRFSFPTFQAMAAHLDRWAATNLPGPPLWVPARSPPPPPRPASLNRPAGAAGGPPCRVWGVKPGPEPGAGPGPRPVTVEPMAVNSHRFSFPTFQAMAAHLDRWAETTLTGPQRWEETLADTRSWL